MSRRGTSPPEKARSWLNPPNGAYRAYFSFSPSSYSARNRSPRPLWRIFASLSARIGDFGKPGWILTVLDHHSGKIRLQKSTDLWGLLFTANVLKSAELRDSLRAPSGFSREGPGEPVNAVFRPPLGHFSPFSRSESRKI